MSPDVWGAGLVVALLVLWAGVDFLRHGAPGGRR